MKKEYSEREIIKLASRIEFGPDEKFVRRVSEIVGENRFDEFVKEEKKRNYRRGVKYSAACCAVVVVIGLLVSLMNSAHRVSADDFSYDVYQVNTTVDVSDEFSENEIDSSRMAYRFWKSLPYSGKFPACPAIGDYMVEGFYANEYPDYYAGRYINIDGNLIVQIKDTYYCEKYRRCDWYLELAKMLGSENFRCHRAKYNYSELINAIDTVTLGEKAEEIRSAGIRVAGVGINDYLNCVEVDVRSAEDADRIRELLSSDIYKIIIFDYEAIDT